MTRPGVAVIVFSCALLLALEAHAQLDPSRFAGFLAGNVFTKCPPVQPLSYLISPSNYFATVPLNMRVDKSMKANASQNIPSCQNRLIPPEKLDAYQYQTEEMIIRFGLNIYDGAVWMVANALLGQHDLVWNYYSQVLTSLKTCQWASIAADAPCKGIVSAGQCTGGACGLCYGDGPNQTLTGASAWFIKNISPLYSIQGIKDARCPDLGIQWTWNSWQPVLGENSWARLVGPLQAAYLRVGKDINSIPEDVIVFSLRYIPSLTQMLIPEIGAVYYAPHNSWGIKPSDGPNGSEISTENQASTLSGLLILRKIMISRNYRPDLLPPVNNLINGIVNYLRNSYDAQNGFFRSGGDWDFVNKRFSWYSTFATDCQTWTLSVLGPNVVDGWFGQGTSDKIWANTKLIAGYKVSGTQAQGLGYTTNANDQIFSGEWTLGGVNMLNIFANLATDPYKAQAYRAEASVMRAAVENELTRAFTMDNGQSAKAVKYANKRYWIPFGWWANPFASLASTGWAVFLDAKYNPLYLGGDYDVYSLN